MVHKRLLAGLDIGTTKVSAVIAQHDGDNLEIVGVGGAASEGLKRGEIVNIESTVQAIRQAVTQAEEQASCEISTVFVSITGNNVHSMNKIGVTRVQKAQVDHDDIDRVIDIAQTLNLSDNKKIIHVLPQEFILDGTAGIQDPMNMTGVRLETMVHIVTADVTPVQNLMICCSRAQLEVRNFILQSLASAEAILIPEEKELGVVLVDIGGGTTDCAVFYGGTVRHTFSVPMGGNQLTGDLAYSLRTSNAEAQRLKETMGSVMLGNVNPNQIIEVPSGGDRGTSKISLKIVCEMLGTRMTEILELVRDELQNAGYTRRIHAGAVLTGGGAMLPQTISLAEQSLDMPVRIGSPHLLDSMGDHCSPRNATAAGLILFGKNMAPQCPEYNHPGLKERVIKFLRGWS